MSHLTSHLLSLAVGAVWIAAAGAILVAAHRAIRRGGA
ncbi:hypothetical protein J421_5168 (plasmid) [Gemmatirosa kalamazoonensis]|jgi:hypothetical protein|uniref:Uncharacterized protein n=1 Tax=Gemmatirosa kalamazoonensis TaxID=861299 RepID=W0RT22_9BACT|nr:hypothetical protein J421_5168 [Gemmatirosa kalamazoonensis]